MRVKQRMDRRRTKPTFPGAVRCLTNRTEDRGKLFSCLDTAKEFRLN